MLYHRRSWTPDEWDRVGTYETLEAAREAAGQHGTRPGAKLQAWIIERSDVDEWRVVAGGEVYKAKRVRLPE